MNAIQKEIVLIHYPFSDLEGKKVRPAIIVSNDDFNRNSDDCVAIPVTTVIKEEPYSIFLNQSDLVRGRLLKPSRIRADKIFTLEKSLIVMKIGLVNDVIFDKIKKELNSIF